MNFSLLSIYLLFLITQLPNLYCLVGSPPKSYKSMWLSFLVGHLHLGISWKPHSASKLKSPFLQVILGFPLSFSCLGEWPPPPALLTKAETWVTLQLPSPPCTRHQILTALPCSIFEVFPSTPAPSPLPSEGGLL